MIPFNPAREAYLRVPKEYRRDPVLLRPVQRPPLAKSGNSIASQSLLPNGAGYEDSVSRILATMREQNISKTVMARTVTITLNEALDRQTVLSNMLHSNPAGYTYALPLPGGKAQDPDLFLEPAPSCWCAAKAIWLPSTRWQVQPRALPIRNAIRPAQKP